MKAILRKIRISPEKANLVAALVRNKKVIDAINILKFTPKASARPLKKLIESAVANAENNFKQQREDLIIKEILVTKGPTYKRGVSVSRGRVHPILKRTAHITVKLENQKKENDKTETEAKVTKKVKTTK
ncbi:MAG: 50S ribosomal protein L22 [Candidatus Peregrinibacteria bacterium]